jgi:hypothetical protein
VSFQITVLKVLDGHPEGRASLADLTRCVSILISSGKDWTNRTKRLAARVPKLDIFGASFVLRDDRGWQITQSGRQFLASIETPLPMSSESAQAPEAAITKEPMRKLPLLRLVVSNEEPRPEPRFKTLAENVIISSIRRSANLAAGLPRELTRDDGRCSPAGGVTGGEALSCHSEKSRL